MVVDGCPPDQAAQTDAPVREACETQPHPAEVLVLCQPAEEEAAEAAEAEVAEAEAAAEEAAEAAAAEVAEAEAAEAAEAAAGEARTPRLSSGASPPSRPGTAGTGIAPNSNPNPNPNPHPNPTPNPNPNPDPDPTQDRHRAPARPCRCPPASQSPPQSKISSKARPPPRMLPGVPVSPG